MKKKTRIGKIAAVMLAAAFVFTAVGTVNLLADPGDSSDPIITLSYIENVLKGEMSFKVVSLNKGERLMCSAGTELVLRAGEASVIATAKGGLADVTDGVDLSDDSSVPMNHQLIVPLADGRGIKAKNSVLVMVKGQYTIE